MSKHNCITRDRSDGRARQRQGPPRSQAHANLPCGRGVPPSFEAAVAVVPASPRRHFIWMMRRFAKSPSLLLPVHKPTMPRSCGPSFRISSVGDLTSPTYTWIVRPSSSLLFGRKPDLELAVPAVQMVQACMIIVEPHSARSATIGSTRVARRTGMSSATVAQPTRIATALPRAIGSNGGTP
jgi:hypothetical protein